MRTLAIQAIVATALASADTLAQESLVVPPELAVNESPAFGMLAGFEERRRQQVLIHEAMLVPLRGKTVRALVFRRDELMGLELTATTASLEVVMSTTGVAVSAPSRVFADNHGANRRIVLRGMVALPRSPSVQPPIPWTPINTARLNLSPGFTYRGGHLCVQFDGAPHSPPPDPTCGRSTRRIHSAARSSRSASRAGSRPFDGPFTPGVGDATRSPAGRSRFSPADAGTRPGR